MNQFECTPAFARDVTYDCTMVCSTWGPCRYKTTRKALHGDGGALSHCAALGALLTGAPVPLEASPGGASGSAPSQTGGATDNVAIEYALQKVLHERVVQGLLNNQKLTSHVPKGGCTVAQNDTNSCNHLRCTVCRQAHWCKGGREGRDKNWETRWMVVPPVPAHDISGGANCVVECRHESLRKCALLHGYHDHVHNVVRGHV